MFSDCEIIYVLATVTTKNKNLINKKLLNKMKPNSVFVLMSRAESLILDLKKELKREIYMSQQMYFLKNL